MSKVVIILFLLSTLFFTFNIQGQDFSLDEPDTISIAASLKRSFIPEAWDGKNFSPIEPHIFTVRGNHYVWSWHPWFQHYIAYIGILLFGRTSPLVRIPFALFGSATVAMVYLVGMKIFNNKLTSILIATHLMLLLPFFLYMRQVRYYSIGAFLSLCVFLLALELIKSSKMSKKYIFITALTLLLLFLTNYIVWMSSVFLLGLVTLYKRKPKVIIPILFSILFALIWYYLLKPFQGNFAYHRINLQQIYQSLLTYKYYIAEYIFPLILILPLITIFNRYRKFVCLIIVWIVVKILIYSIFLIPHGRYIVDIFPILVLLIGFLYDYMIKKRKAYLAILLLILITSSNFTHNVPSLISNRRSVVLRNWISAYRYEFTIKKPFIMPQIAEYLKKDYKPGDLFWSNEYKLHIYNHAGIPHLSAICDISKNKLIGPDEVIDIRKVKWFIFFQDDTLFPKTLETLCGGKAWQKYLVKNYKPNMLSFKKGTVKLNDPDIVRRQFPPYEVDSRSVVIYKKKIDF